MATGVYHMSLPGGQHKPILRPVVSGSGLENRRAQAPASLRMQRGDEVPP